MTDIAIHCKYDELIDPRLLMDFGRNPNKHPPEQITRLAKLYQYQGVRHPIIVDKERHVIAAGHGRKYGAIEAGMALFPVVYQSFETEEQLYNFVVSDNAVQDFAELDMARINADITSFGPFDVELLGFEDFKIDPTELPNEPTEKAKKACPQCGYTG